jgi:hypothetical protein
MQLGGDFIYKPAKGRTKLDWCGCGSFAVVSVV